MITKIEQYAKALDKLNATGVNLKCSENGTIEVIWTNGKICGKDSIGECKD